jgi:hypothetical protein
MADLAGEKKHTRVHEVDASGVAADGRGARIVPCNK